jgi:hypothetical protein
VAPSSSPAPGSADNPVWTAQIRPNARIIAALDLTVKLITLAYVVAGAWQVALIMHPPLRMRQDAAIAAVRRRLRPPPETLPQPPAAVVREIYDDTR